VGWCRGILAGICNCDRCLLVRFLCGIYSARRIGGSAAARISLPACPLSGRDLSRGRWHPGLAILRRCNQADNRNKGAGTRLVTGGQANDREFDPLAWLGEATARSRNHCRGDRCADSRPRAKSSHCGRHGTRSTCRTSRRAITASLVFRTQKPRQPGDICRDPPCLVA
jgi:hypothetical protein